MQLRRRIATVTSAVAAALVGVLLIASPAYAEGEVEVEINGLSDSIQAGASQFDDFRAVFTNVSDEPISGVFVVITVSLPGAPPESIHVQRSGSDLPYSAFGDGTVAFTDSAPFDLGRGGGNARRRVDYFISFGNEAPEGEASLTVAAYAGGELLGSDDTSIRVRGGAGRTTPPNTDPGFVPTFTAGPTYSVAPLTEAAAVPPGDRGTVPKAVYVLGSLLVAVGLVTLLLILFPPGRRFAPGGGAGREPGPGPRPAGVQVSGGPGHPRPPHPGAFGTGAPQHWPVVATPPPPVRRPGAAQPGPQTGRVADHGAYPRPARPVRDPRAGDPHTDDPRWHTE